MLLEHIVAQLTQVERSASLKIAILFAVHVQIDRAPDAGTSTANDDHRATVDGQVECGTGSTDLRMVGGLQSIAVRLSTAILPHADQSSAEETDAGFLWGEKNRISEDPPRWPIEDKANERIN